MTGRRDRAAVAWCASVRRTSTPRSRRDERGAAATEFALLVPTLVLLIGLVVGGARVWLARANVEQVAASAARAASSERSAPAGIAAARRVADLQARNSSLRCASLQVEVDATGFRVPVGGAASVGVRVRCAVPLTDVFVPGWPGHLALESSAESTLDRYRERQP